MSSEEFIQVFKGRGPKSAFNAAVKQALHDHGHSGYTGSIAEKMEEGFVMFPLPKTGDENLEQRAIDEASRLMGHGQSGTRDGRIDSKYQPAGCIEIQKGTYVFFGFAQT
jgi:hypothetical protein